MARSPAHAFGQKIGEVLEQALEPLLSDFAQRHGLYLDRKGERPARRAPGSRAAKALRKVTWRDSSGNAHDLDYVLERNGSPTEIGTPVAFIEVAWRRYTKHARNKVQEIEGAILPLAPTYSAAHPFMGAVLAGCFTEPALQQLRSEGFAVLLIPPATVVDAFRVAGIDVRCDESTPDAVFEEGVRAWNGLTEEDRARVSQCLLGLNQASVDDFLRALERTVTRRIERVRVLPLHGEARDCTSVGDAIAFVQDYPEEHRVLPVARYEVEIRYTNGDVITGRFSTKIDAIQFLRSYQGA